MAIVLEFIDFILPVALIARKYPGGWEQCLADHRILIRGAYGSMRICFGTHLRIEPDWLEPARNFLFAAIKGNSRVNCSQSY
jgi:hypothetical protein